MILENSTQPLATLDSEWTINKLYTEIEHIRFDKHFSYQFENLNNIVLKKYLIPPMMLQPLIENAIAHGLRHKSQNNSNLTIRLYELEKHIEIKVIDNGSGLLTEQVKKPSFKKSSFGLSSIKDRIEIINKNSTDANASFEIIDRIKDNEKGCISTLTLPKLEVE